MYLDRNGLFSGDYVLALTGCCPLKFLDALEIDLGYLVTLNGDGGPQGGRGSPERSLIAKKIIFA